MKVQDFRIGNIVNYFYNETCLNGVVTSVNKKSITINNHATIKIKTNNISPIPLTEEWLLKFGYITHSHQKNYYTIKGHIIWKCNEMFLCDKNGVHIKYVHQLQNLYWVLNGEELVIKEEIK
jgi:hypothetical protein